MALDCWKQGRYSGRWRRVHLLLRDRDLTYTKGSALRQLKNPGVSFAWIQQVREVGATTGGCRPAPRRWEWAVLLNAAGKKGCGVSMLYFRCESRQVPHHTAARARLRLLG